MIRRKVEADRSRTKKRKRSEDDDNLSHLTGAVSILPLFPSYQYMSNKYSSLTCKTAISANKFMPTCATSLHLSNSWLSTLADPLGDEEATPWYHFRPSRRTPWPAPSSRAPRGGNARTKHLDCRRRTGSRPILRRGRRLCSCMAGRPG